MNNYNGYNPYYAYYGAQANYNMQNPAMQQNFNNPYLQQGPQGVATNPIARDFAKNNLNGFDGYYVDNYQDVKSAIVSADGTPSIFISNNEDKFWIKKINSEDGRTIVKSFLFYESLDDSKPKNETAAPVIGEQKLNEMAQINQVLVNKIQELEFRLTNLEQPGSTVMKDEGKKMQNNLLQMISSMMQGGAGSNNPMNMFMNLMQQQSPQMAQQFQNFARGITPEQAKQQVMSAIQSGKISQQQMSQLQQMFTNMNMGDQYNAAMKELGVDINTVNSTEAITQTPAPKTRF